MNEIKEKYRKKYMALIGKFHSFTHDNVFHDCASYGQSTELFDQGKYSCEFQDVFIKELKKDVMDTAMLDRVLKEYDSHLDEFEERVVKEAKRRCNKL
jgi:hypothetical protein